MSEDGRKQQAKLKELAHIAEKLGCTLPQLAIGKGQHLHPKTPNFPFILKRTNKLLLITTKQHFLIECFLIPLY